MKIIILTITVILSQVLFAQDSLISFETQKCSINRGEELIIKGKLDFNKPLSSGVIDYSDLNCSFTNCNIDSIYESLEILKKTRFFEPLIFYKLKGADSVYSIRQRLGLYPPNFYCDSCGRIKDNNLKKLIKCNQQDSEFPITFISKPSTGNEYLFDGIPNLMPKSIESENISIRLNTMKKLNLESISCFYLILPVYDYSNTKTESIIITVSF
jgi:hypothetical protein